MGKFIFISFLTFLVIPLTAQERGQSWQQLALPEQGEIWVTPAQGKPAQPVWGHTNGITVGLAPMPGPRGLLRIYTPYLGLAEGRMLNFIAVEPIPAGKSARGFSELEMSDLDNRRGKKFWSSDDSLALEPRDEVTPAKGIITKAGDIEILTVFVFVEPFKNDSKVYLRLRFFSDRPFEFEITTYKRDDSGELENCILTATMGNLARLRTLYLAGKTTTSRELWPDYTADAFAPHAKFTLDEMIVDKKGNYYFIAAPDEKDPQKAVFSEGTAAHWKYEGKFATQYWYSNKPDPQLVGLVNGRVVYWAGKSPIPGGIAFENFEVKEPFRNGAKYIFGVVPLKPEEFIRKLKK